MNLNLERYDPDDDEWKIEDCLLLEIVTHIPPLTKTSIIVWLEDHGVVFEDE
jgi:hypothetical protein